MTRYDALIAGAGPAGALTALLTHGQGRNVVVAEVRGVAAMRTNLARFSSDAQRLISQVDAGNGLFPAYEPRVGPRSFVAPIRDVEQSLRAAAGRAGVPVHYDTSFFDVVQHPGGGVSAKVRTAHGIEHVEAPVLIDATGGSFAGQLDPSLRLRHVGGDGHAIGVHWERGTPAGGWNDPAAAATGDVAALRLSVGGGKFVGHHDALRGTFGVLELPSRPAPAEQDGLVRALAAGLGLDGDPALRYDFAISNRIAERAWSGSIAMVGDSVTKLRPRTGMGVNLAVLDAQDGARLIDDLARTDASQPASLAAMERQRTFEAFGAAVMRRHRSALHTEQAPSPFAR